MKSNTGDAMSKENFANFSRDDLIREIKKLKKRKKYGIVWDEEKTKEKFEKSAEGNLPVLKEIENKEIKSKTEEPTNILIEGDNYHAVSVLNYTHQKSIDVIYIDPPYNTGNGDTFRYNDKIVDKEDAYRHSKWLSFMAKRLRLARNLLTKYGIILISINENEFAQLKLLCDEIFGESNFIENLIWVKNSTKNDSRDFATVHEYVLVYARDLKARREKELRMVERKPGFDEVMGFAAKWRKEKTPLNIAIKEIRDFYRKHPEFKGLTQYKHIEIKNGKYLIFREDNAAWPQGDGPKYNVIHPITRKKCKVPERGWRWTEDTFKKHLENDLIVFGKDETKVPQFKRYLHTMPDNVVKSVVINNDDGDVQLRNILGSSSFEHPKPTSLIKWILSFFGEKEFIVLDFFAGSGTTGQATLELNKEDGGKRKFILCTNNENNICTDVCYPRLVKVMNGYKNQKNTNVNGLAGNLKYFKTTFVEGESTDQNKKKLVDQSTEMLCLKEDCFEEIMSKKFFKIFKNHHDHYLGIIYDDDGIEQYKKEIKKLNKKISTYVFSLDESAREEEFEDVAKLVSLKPIPEVILNVYRRIFR